MKINVGHTPNYCRGIRIVEERGGRILLTFTENYDSPFRSPVVVNRQFETWNEAINFVAIWEALQYIRFW